MTCPRCHSEFEHADGACGDPPREERASQTVENARIEKRPAHETIGAADDLGYLDLAAPIEDLVSRVVIGWLSRADAADLLATDDGGPDVGALREEAAAIRRNLEEMAADRALGLVTRAQMLAASERGNTRLAEIDVDVEHAGRENVLTPLVMAQNAAAAWEDLDLSRKRAVIKTLMTVTLLSPGKGARRAFDPVTVQVDWRQPVD